MKVEKKHMKKEIKKLLKRFLKVEYESDGSYKLLHLPFRFDQKRAYKRKYAGKPIVPNKIVFDNYMGKGYGCNCKYVAEQILKAYPGKFDLVWVVSKSDMQAADFPDGIRVVEYGSDASLQEYATAKIWVSNYHKIAYVKKGLYKRPGQYFIQIWHGSLGIKKIENNVAGLTSNENWTHLARLSSQMVDYWISNSSFETQVYREAFWDVKNILEYGHPRNDLLLGDTGTVRTKVEESLGVVGKKILLYAPTFREDYRLDCYDIDFDLLKERLQQRFGGEWAILIRLHPRVREFATSVIPQDAAVHDVTFYPDIQELLAAADCMISDYSSCIFDFALTKRPAFIYATDIAQYDNERGFYYPLRSTPFPVATDNGELMHNIELFDERSYQAALKAFLRDKGCVDDGHASERVAAKILELTGMLR